jgi:NADH:ubiquinone oxidoreductase subunit
MRPRQDNPMKKFLLQFFTWWNGQTLGTRFHTWRHGTEVGRDEFGNIYYEGGTDSEGRTRRWVIYADLAEASMIPPGWHGWIHHRVDTPPSKENYAAREWQKPHLPNLTGSAAAYRPKGSLLSGTHRPQVTGDYDAWTPGG